LLGIINDILDFSKIEAGRMDLEGAPFDLRECVESALELVAPKASEKDLELAYLMEPLVPAAIVGDVTRLRQILVNLLGNAVKFTECGEVVVTLTKVSHDPLGTAQDTTEMASTDRPLPEQDMLAQVPPPPVFLHFCVRDTGLGIPPDRIDRLFQSFSQVDSSTTRKYGGTGLGLAISRRLVELMGGRMWVESAGIPGQGSTFHFTIQALPVSLSPRPHTFTEKPDLRGRRVLIVDDNATNRRIFGLQTQGWGMVPSDTNSPAEALAWLRQGKVYDVALIDRQMPDMDGLELASEIKQLWPELPLILVSSLSQRECGSETECFAATLLKPVRAAHLYDTLADVLAIEERREKGRQQTAPSEFDKKLGERLPLKILVAEDHVVNQKLALLMLTRLGYRADVAANGLEVLETLARRPYDVVLMDMQMPEMDGIEATREICRLWSAGSRPHIIAMTANVTKEDREACFDAGMDDFLSKPIRVEELVSALRRSRPASGPKQNADQPGISVGLSGSAVSETVPQELTGSVLDQAALDILLALVDGDQELLGELIDSFLEETPQLLAKLRLHLNENDAAGLQQAAHPLKSSSKDFGATRLSDLARQLEELGKAGTISGAEALVEMVESEFPLVKLTLDTIRKDGVPGRNVA
jgi:CheY-like chemotaxis protein